MSAERARIAAIARALREARRGDPVFATTIDNEAREFAMMLDAYFAHTRFVREVAGTSFRFKPEPLE